MEELVDLYIGKENVKIIFEAGACDCEDSLKLAYDYPNSHVYAFECNPETLTICKGKLKDMITLTEKAVSDVNGEVTFYPIDTKRTITSHTNGNPGASSMFKASGLYPIETYVQNEIKVPSITLKTFCEERHIDEIDLLWLDAQGAELKILKGLGEAISNVKIIKTEVEFKPQYTDAPLFEEVLEFLESKGFRFAKFLGNVDSESWFDDAIFINTKL
jgi:FkbM family methyltransferase